MYSYMCIYCTVRGYSEGVDKMPMTVGFVLAKQEAKAGSAKFDCRWGLSLIRVAHQTFVSGPQPNLSRAEKLPYVYGDKYVFCLLALCNC